MNAQLARSFEGVVHFYQPSDSEEEQGWDEYIGVGVDEVGVDEVTSQQIKGKIQENRELQIYWEEFLQVN